MKVTVVYGRCPNINDALTCGFCEGTGVRMNRIKRSVKCGSCDGKGWSYDNGYCYSTDEPVAVGDVVRVPASHLFPEREATVVALESDWTGPTRTLLGVVERAA